MASTVKFISQEQLILKNGYMFVFCFVDQISYDSITLIPPAKHVRLCPSVNTFHTNSASSSNKGMKSDTFSYNYINLKKQGVETSASIHTPLFK